MVYIGIENFPSQTTCQSIQLAIFSNNIINCIKVVIYSWDIELAEGYIQQVVTQKLRYNIINSWCFNFFNNIINSWESLIFSEQL